MRILSILDEYTRECLLLKAARSFPARRVFDALEEVMVCSGRKPQYLRSDNGPEFVAKSLQSWLKQAQVGPRYIEPGAPWENAHVESFHAQVRLELLDRELFSSTCEKSMQPLAITPMNTTSNAPTAAWINDPRPWRRSVNFRSGLRPALQFTLAIFS